MRNSKNILKQSIIQVRNNLNQQDLEEEVKEKKEKNNNNEFTKLFTTKKTKEDKLLINAYKNVITVLTNILDNIEDEKANGKVNMFGTHRMIDNKNKPKNKKPIKKIISYDIPKIHYSIDVPKNRPFHTLESIKNHNTLKVNNNSPLKLSLNWKAKQLFYSDNNSNYEGSACELSSFSLNSGRIKQTRIIYKKHKLKDNSFFKPKNRLYSRWNSSKNVLTNTSKDKKFKKSLINKNSIDMNIYNSSLSSCSVKNSYNLKSNRKSISILQRSSNCLLNLSNISSSIQPEEESQKEIKINEEPMSPFSNFRPKVKASESEENTYSYGKIIIKFMKFVH